MSSTATLVTRRLNMPKNWLAGNPSPSLGSLLRARREWAKRAKTRRGRRLAAHRRFDEYEIFLPHRTRARNPSRSNGPVYRLHGD